MAEPIVRIEGLSFRYRRGTEPAIRDLDLEVAPGEVLLVAGPSGCNVRVASLMRANAQWRRSGDSFLNTDAFAAWAIARSNGFGGPKAAAVGTA